MARNILSRADLAPAAAHYAAACRASREHNALAADALTKHGDHGPQISGCIRGHFPEDIKDQLRALARATSTHCDAAWAARPRGVRHSTMRALARAIARRDGSGFYGPQG